MHDGTTPLILAARLAVEGMLEDLINSHADVNAVDDLGRPRMQPSWQGCVTAAWSAPDPLYIHFPSRQVGPALGSCCEQRGCRRCAPEEWREQGYAEQQGELRAGAEASPRPQSGGGHSWAHMCRLPAGHPGHC